MSSHHIVRDNQEPALLILNAEATHFSIIEQLLEWSPFVVIDESQMSFFVARGIKIDAVITPAENQVFLSNTYWEQLPLEFIRFDHPTSSLSVALNYLTNKGHGAVNIITSQITVLDELERNTRRVNFSVVMGPVRWSLVRHSYSKIMSVNSNVWVRFNGQQYSQATNHKGKIALDFPHPFWIGESISDELLGNS